MKRKKIIFILMITVIIFIGCNGDKKDMKELSMTLTLDGDFNKKIVIPDPVTAGDEVSVVMRYLPNFSDYGDYKEEREYFQSNTVDLSFLGFKNEMMLMSYQIGTVTSQTSGYVHIHYNIPDNYKYDKELSVMRDREVHANCLVLAARDSIEENDNNYVIVLDYENHKSYVEKTEIWNPMADGVDHMPELQLCDFTGDGLDEVVLSNALQEEQTNVQVFRFNENDLKCIYSGLKQEKKDECVITGYLEDDYKAVIEYKPLGLKKKRNLLDLGFTKRQLRDKNLEVGVAQDMKIHRITDYEEVMQYHHFVFLARGNTVCKLMVYLKYSARQDVLEIYKIDVKWLDADWEGPD